MQIDSLNIGYLRNLSSVALKLGPSFNLFWGPNGSGKTSILEAIHLLSSGRSFRSLSAKNILTIGQSRCWVSARVSSAADQGLGASMPIGIERSANGVLKMRIAEQECHSIGTLARVLAVQLINSESYALLEGDPSVRRKFLNWIMFHVEHSFHGTWQRFSRALEQRNALLKTENPKEFLAEMPVWNQEIVEYGEMIDAQRKALVVDLLPIFSNLMTELLPLKTNISIEYQQGWPKGVALAGALEQSVGRDLALKYTTVGPHRAELEILLNGIPAKSFLSRGELKIFICGLLISRAILLKQKENRQCIFLVDDLHAELDERATGVVLSALKSLKTQVFVTSIEADVLMRWFQGEQIQCFGLSDGIVTVKS